MRPLILAFALLLPALAQANAPPPARPEPDHTRGELTIVNQVITQPRELPPQAFHEVKLPPGNYGTSLPMRRNFQPELERSTQLTPGR
ncbi:MAG: hypothetical protein JST54_33615 [Deltaproteobacteria bacterium]|nr:hypothetical protein [Deltaproteobacteria bacterium]